MTDLRHAKLVALVDAQHHLIGELREAVRELAAMLDRHSPIDTWLHDRQRVVVMVGQVAAEAGLSAPMAWGGTHKAADCRRRVALALRAAGWKTARIARAFGTDPSTVHNLMHRHSKRRARAESAPPVEAAP